MPKQDAWLVVEIAALLVSTLGLVLQGVQARRESLKDDRPVARGLIELYVKLDAWRSRGAATNSELHAWLDPVVGPEATVSPEEIRRVLDEDVPESLRSAIYSQSGWLRDIQDDPSHLQHALGVLQVYGPDSSSSEQLRHALESRGDLLRGLAFRGFATAAVHADVDGLKDLLNDADETLRLLNEGADMLRAFIRGHIPLEQYEGLAASLE
jgi:hypothetical protein